MWQGRKRILPKSRLRCFVSAVIYSQKGFKRQRNTSVYSIAAGAVQKTVIFSISNNNAWLKKHVSKEVTICMLNRLIRLSLSIYISIWFLIHGFNSIPKLNVHAEFLQSSVASTTEFLAYIPNFKRRTSELNAFFFFFLQYKFPKPAEKH